MKKLITLSAIALTAMTVHAQSPDMLQSEIRMDNKAEKIIRKEKREDRKEIGLLKGVEVSSMSKNNFRVDFGNIPVMQWTRLDNFDEATFAKNGQVKSAFYDSNAKLVGTTQAKKYSELPVKAQELISQKYYKGYTHGDVIFFDDNEQNETDMILYGNQFADRDSYFVELTKDNKKIVVQVEMDGEVSYFTRLR